jgi:insertion element IS1 protein InsB
VFAYVCGRRKDAVLLKLLVRKTICFSKSVQMHDIVIGLFVNRYAFGRLV